MRAPSPGCRIDLLERRNQLTRPPNRLTACRSQLSGEWKQLTACQVRLPGRRSDLSVHCRHLVGKS
jgi:hypothetical protein